MNKNLEDLKNFLDDLVKIYNTKSFIETDPIQVPHMFSKKEDIEIAAFFASIFAWGKRSIIIKKSLQLMELFDFAPYDFIINSTEQDIKKLINFKHRTFNFQDLTFFISSLRNIYLYFGGLENVFFQGYKKNKSIKDAIAHFRKVFFSLEHLKRTEKHISNVEKNSAAKRINMFLMWLVRYDDAGVHFGIWKKINKKHLMMPLDVHIARISRDLGLLTRKQNDWKAVEELTNNLKIFDPDDPVKYDFALFGLDLNPKVNIPFSF